MTKKGTVITWADVNAVMNNIEREHLVKIEFTTTKANPGSKDDVAFTHVASAYRRTTAGRGTIRARASTYFPSRAHRSITGACVALLYDLLNTLDEQVAAQRRAEQGRLPLID